MKFLKTALISTILALSLAACGEKEVPQDIVDTNMTTSRLNAQKNANAFMGTVYPDAGRVLVQADSTISKTCRHGDGWASGTVDFFEGPNKGRTVKIKCQTNGSGKGINGCMTEQDFLTKTYKGEEGNCQNLEAMEKMK